MATETKQQRIEALATLLRQLRNEFQVVVCRDGKFVNVAWFERRIARINAALEKAGVKP